MQGVGRRKGPVPLSPQGHRACLSTPVVAQPREPQSMTKWPPGHQGSPCPSWDLGALCIRYHEAAGLSCPAEGKLHVLSPLGGLTPPLSLGKRPEGSAGRAGNPAPPLLSTHDGAPSALGSLREKQAGEEPLASISVTTAPHAASTAALPPQQSRSLYPTSCSPSPGCPTAGTP